MSDKTIAVIGAGLVGRLTAWRLASNGFSVTLLDRASRHSRSSAGLTAAAMIAPYTESVFKDAQVCAIGLESVKLWSGIIPALEALSGEQIFCEFNGTLVLAHSQDKEDWHGFNAMAKAKLGDDAFASMSREQISQIEPELSERFHEGSYFEGEGVLCNDQLYHCLALALDHLGVNWLEQVEVKTKSDLNEYGAYDWIIDCRGIGALSSCSAGRNPVNNNSDWPIDYRDLRGVRGEIVRVHAPDVNIQRPVRLIHPRYPLYIAPHGNHQYVVGATEIESDAMHNVTVRSGLELLSALFSVHSGFSEARIISMEANLRPAYPDNLPRIRVNDNMISVNGLYRHGYLFAPALLEDVCHYMAGNADLIQFNHLFESVSFEAPYENFG